MVQNYVTYVVKTFSPELIPASDFYARLAEEVKIRDPFARMYSFPDDPKVTREGGRTTVEANYIAVPNDLFTELNIKVIKKAN